MIELHTLENINFTSWMSWIMFFLFSKTNCLCSISVSSMWLKFAFYYILNRMMLTSLLVSISIRSSVIVKDLEKRLSITISCICWWFVYVVCYLRTIVVWKLFIYLHFSRIATKITLLVGRWPFCCGISNKIIFFVFRYHGSSYCWSIHDIQQMTFQKWNDFCYIVSNI